MSTRQIKNGKAFEYAIAKTYSEHLTCRNIPAFIRKDAAYNKAKAFYESFTQEEKTRFDKAASATIGTLLKIEPGFTALYGEGESLQIRIATDSEGKDGDVRDIIFNRTKQKWEVGFSAKNNNDAVKHSRLSPTIDFGEKWLGTPCTTQYWNGIRPVFDYIANRLAERQDVTWNELGEEKNTSIYRPVLSAFRDEILRLDSMNDDIPAKLVSYLIGEYSFYKIIKDDMNNLVVVKAFNINGQLNKPVNGTRANYKTPAINLPKRIVEFDFLNGSDNTLGMILDGGWEISFRIHNASSALEQSLKFDVRLLGNPPILFSQYLFQE